MRLRYALTRDKRWNFLRLLTPALSSFGEEREIYFVGRLPGVAASRQHRANFRSAFSAFELAVIREIHVSLCVPCVLLRQIEFV